MIDQEVNFLRLNFHPSCCTSMLNWREEIAGKGRQAGIPGLAYNTKKLTRAKENFRFGPGLGTDKEKQGHRARSEGTFDVKDRVAASELKALTSTHTWNGVISRLTEAMEVQYTSSGKALGAISRDQIMVLASKTLIADSLPEALKAKIGDGDGKMSVEKIVDAVDTRLNEVRFPEPTQVKTRGTAGAFIQWLALADFPLLCTEAGRGKMIEAMNTYMGPGHEPTNRHYIENFHEAHPQLYKASLLMAFRVRSTLHPLNMREQDGFPDKVPAVENVSLRLRLGLGQFFLALMSGFKSFFVRIGSFLGSLVRSVVGGNRLRGMETFGPWRIDSGDALTNLGVADYTEAMQIRNNDINITTDFDRALNHAARETTGNLAQGEENLENLSHITGKEVQFERHLIERGSVREIAAAMAFYTSLLKRLPETTVASRIASRALDLDKGSDAQHLQRRELQRRYAMLFTGLYMKRIQKGVDQRTRGEATAICQHLTTDNPQSAADTIRPSQQPSATLCGFEHASE
jgi:hypothetical protein